MEKLKYMFMSLCKKWYFGSVLYFGFEIKSTGWKTHQNINNWGILGQRNFKETPANQPISLTTAVTEH